MRPTARAVLLLALGFPLALMPALVHARLWPLWVAFVAVASLAIGLDGILLPRAKELALAAELPAQLMVGLEGAAELRISFPGARAVRIIADLSPNLAPQPPLIRRLEPAGIALSLRLMPVRRGRAVLERLWVRLSGPLGLMSRVLRVEMQRSCPIVPDVSLVRTLALRLARDSSLHPGLKIERYLGDGSEFESLREFSRGDDPRSIDWKVTARHRKLLVRQHRAERNHQVILAIDSGHLMAESLAGIPKLDHALKAALYLAYISLHAGDRVGLAAFDARLGLFVEPLSGVHSFSVLNRMASRIDVTERESNYTLALTSIGQRLHRRSLLVLLTDFVDSTAAELMIENLGRLARRHVVVIVALRDPLLPAVAGAKPDSLLDLNRAVVAGGFLREREIVLRKLRRLGVLSIDAAPGEISPRLVNAYLEIKRRERI